MRVVAVITVAFSSGLGGCDKGEGSYATSPGPTPELVAVNVGTGKACPPRRGEAFCVEGVNLRPRVVLQFDRIMALSSGARANFKIVSGTSGNLTFIQPRVDPVERTVVFALGPTAPPLERNTEYRLLVEDSQRAPDRLAAFDGTPFVGRAVVRFTTGEDTTAQNDVDPAPVEPCKVTEILRVHCAGAACHDAVAPAMGLSLVSDQAIAATALDRGSVLVQQASEPSGTGEATRRFPVGLPLVARGASAQSFLLYKILMDGRRTDARTTRELRARIPGAPMPATDDALEPSSSPAGALSLQDVRTIRRWIDGGAPSCRTETDAGPPGEDATSDVATDALADGDSGD